MVTLVVCSSASACRTTPQFPLDALSNIFNNNYTVLFNYNEGNIYNNNNFNDNNTVPVRIGCLLHFQALALQV